MSQQSNIGSPSTRKTDGLRFPGPMTPPSVQSNPHTPGSPSTRLSQVECLNFVFPKRSQFPLLFLVKFVLYYWFRINHFRNESLRNIIVILFWNYFSLYLQQSNVAPSPSTALMGTPSPSTMLPQGSPNPALHVPSPSSFVPAPSPSSLGIHMPSPATQFISPQGRC